MALGVGPLPPFAVGGGLSLGLEYLRWRVQLQGLYWRRQYVPASGFPGYGTEVDRMGAALWVCRELRSSWIGLSPCLTGGMDRVSARGAARRPESNIFPTTRHATAMSAGVGIQGRIPLASWIRLLVAVGGEIELVRPQFLVKGLGPLVPEKPAPSTPIYQFAPAALTATIGLEWAL